MAHYTLIEHGLSPFSDPREILDWLDRLRKMHEASPEDKGISYALDEVRWIARMAGVLPDAEIDFIENL